ncbi:hypothetical protein HPB50_019179 [Hyalomma asiaticum]|uniref:Uncharacterized protein n=1 Tax=Hyalomma asiaticum TaxID=266040 RepID=A0ACB7SRK9_HYAAI|nr:hypothetical protein HPB50_019179 [Hyalomma asiaticum]
MLHPIGLCVAVKDGDKRCTVIKRTAPHCDSDRRRQPRNNRAMDSPRSWLVAVGCCWVNVFSFAMIRSTAVVYVSIIEAFKTTREEASWPVTLASTCYFTAGLSVGQLSLSSTVINQHFVKYRAVASGLNMAGFSIGGLIFPPMVQFFFDEYGFRGAFLLAGGTILNGIVGTLLQRIPAPRQPVQPAHKHRGSHQTGTSKLGYCGGDEKCASEVSIISENNSKGGVENPGFESSESADRGTSPKNAHVIAPSAQRASANEGAIGGRDFPATNRTADSSVDAAVPIRNILLEGQAAVKEDVSQRPATFPEQTLSPGPSCSKTSVTAVGVHPTEAAQRISGGAKSALLAAKELFSFLALAKYYVVVLSKVVIVTNSMTFATVIIDFAMDRGINRWRALTLISAYTSIDLTARLTSGWITDRKILSRKALMAFCMTVWTAANFAFAFGDSYVVLLIVSGVAGWCNGSTLPLIPVLYMEVVDIGRFSVAYGLSSFLVGLTGLPRPALTGKCRDKLGNYSGLFLLTGTCSALSALRWTYVTVQEKCCRNRENNIMDSRRSWVVAGACFWTNVFAYPLLGAAGVVYVNIIRTFHVTREEASWPVSLTSTFYLLAGLLGGILNKYVSIRTILVVSCAVSALLVSACYFTTDMWFLIIVLGVLHGIFVGGIRLNVVAINKHFTKYLASASGMNMAGLSVGGFVLPPLLQLLFDQYGFRGALLICGGISLNAVPAAMLCGDPDKQKPPAEPRETSEEIGFGKDQEQVMTTDLSATVYGSRDSADVLKEKSLKESSRYELLPPVLFDKAVGTPASCLKDSPMTDIEDKLPLKTTASYGRQVLGQDSESVTEHNYGFVLNPHFYLVTLTHLVVFTNMVTCLTVIIDFAVDCGVPKWNAVLLVTVYSTADVVARLGSGWVTDKKYLSRRAWTALCLLCWAAALSSMPLGRSFSSLFVCVIVAGWCNGSCLSLVPVLYAEVTDARRYPLCFGAGSSLVGVANLIRPLLIGKSYVLRILVGYIGLVKLFILLSACELLTSYELPMATNIIVDEYKY